MDKYYNHDYTKEQIDIVLLTIKDCVRRNLFSVAKNENRQENIDFINNYNLSYQGKKIFY